MVNIDLLIFLAKNLKSAIEKFQKEQDIVFYYFEGNTINDIKNVIALLEEYKNKNKKNKE